MMHLYALIAALLTLCLLWLTRLPPELGTVNETGFVLITGASSGIGRHAAEYLANTTSLQILAGVRKEVDAKSILKMNISNLRPIMVDVTSQKSCLKAIEVLKRRMATEGQPFVALVNNAGVASKGVLEYSSVEDSKDMFDINFFGALRLVQLTLPLLRTSKGRIIMMSSMTGIVSLPMFGMYSASKRALEGLSDALRKEVLHQGISVSVIQPAYVKTPIFDKVERSYRGKQVENYEIFTKQSTARNQVYNSASEPIVTSEAIFDGIMSPSPRTRYPVATAAGVPAKYINWLLWLLPDRLEDKWTEYKFS